MALAIFSEERRKWWTLAAVSFGLFMSMLDNTVVNVALPSIQRDLDTGVSELQWIVTGYALSFAALVLIGGKLADTVGRAQAAGGVPADREPDAEAWVFVGAALLLSFADRLGGLLGPDELGAFAAQRHRWLTGSG